MMRKIIVKNQSKYKKIIKKNVEKYRKMTFKIKNNQNENQ